MKHTMAKKTRSPRCRWCNKRLDSRAHRERTESFCFVQNEKAIRSRARPRVKKLMEVYDSEGKIRPEFIGTDMEDKLMQRQRQLALDAYLSSGRNGYHVPKNVDVFIRGGFVLNQISHRYPWAVYLLVMTPKGQQRKRKRFNNLLEAVRFHERAHDKYPSSGIVSLGRSYELPPELRLKKNDWPKRFKWCPRCGQARVFKRVDPPQQFFAHVKVWNENKKKYEWLDRLVWLTECQLCGLTNRDPTFRRCNVPYEVRRIKQGARRVKARVRTERGKKARAAKRARRRVR